MMLLRTMLFTPGNNMRMIARAATLGADAVILDLEDAVPMPEKETARLFVRDSIPGIKPGGPDIFVRVNALTTGLTAEDLTWVIQPRLAGVILPKTESREDVLEIEQLLRDLAGEKGLTSDSIAIMPLIETARGVLNAREIATASKLVVALGFGALDFTRDLGVNLSADGAELSYPRSHLALVARLAEIQAIDTPWIDIADRAGLVRDASRARQLGFRGKLLIHPTQIEPVNEVFSPSETEVAEARRMVKAFREAEARGLGAISLDGKMLDIANVRQAEGLIARAESIARKAGKST